MKVYIVGDHGPEHNFVRSIHKNYKNALKEWNKIRLELLKKAKEGIKYSKSSKAMYEEMIKHLSCKDPEKMEVYHDTPYIQEYELEE